MDTRSLREQPGYVATARLELIPLPHEAYGLLVAAKWEEVEELLGVPLDNSRLRDVAPAARYRFEQLQRDPSEVEWLIHVMRLRDQPVAVGDIGLHAPPDERGMVEIGYTVIEAYRRQGYATEAARGMADWAARQPGVRVLRASISPDNAASLRLARSLGMVQVGSQIDEIDGEELILEAPLPLFPVK